jgi:hypothetical protein
MVQAITQREGDAMPDDTGSKKSVTAMLDAMSVAELTALIEAATAKRQTIRRASSRRCW